MPTRRAPAPARRLVSLSAIAKSPGGKTRRKNHGTDKATFDLEHMNQHVVRSDALDAYVAKYISKTKSVSGGKLNADEAFSSKPVNVNECSPTSTRPTTKRKKRTRMARAAHRFARYVAWRSSMVGTLIDVCACIGIHFRSHIVTSLQLYCE